MLQFVALEPHTLPALAGHFSKLLVDTAQRPPAPKPVPRKPFSIDGSKSM